MTTKAGPLADLSAKHHVQQLFKEIVYSGVCSGCAGCVISCPVEALDYAADRPIVLENCIDCTLCASACPRLESKPVAPEALFGQPCLRSDEIGSYRRLVATKANAAAVQTVAQDGGLVTALLSWAFDQGMIEGAVVAGRFPGGPWRPKPTLVTTKEELLGTAGSAYTYCPNTLALKEVTQRGLSKVAFVGTGCEIAALRQLQAAKSKKLRALAEPVVLAIGLLCSETFDYQPFMEEQIGRSLGVNLADVAKINIKGRVLVTLRSGETLSVPLKAVRPYARQGCHYCQDFSAELADISAGGLGLDGWTVATIRTEQGEVCFDQAVAGGALETCPVEEFPSAMDLYTRLAAKQRERPRRAERAGEQ